MNTNNKRPISDAANVEGSGWKSAEHRHMMVKKIADFLIKHGPPSWKENLSALMMNVERFEERTFGSSKDEAEYFGKISAKMKAINAPHQSDESNILPSNISGSGAEKDTNVEWQEEIYQKVQSIKYTHFTKLNFLYKCVCRKLQQTANPQQSKTAEIEKCEQHKRALEYSFALLQVNKSNITPDFKQKLDNVEKYINSIEQPKNVSSHHQGQHSADLQSKQPFFSSYSRISQLETYEQQTASQVKNLQSSHLENLNFLPNKMHLQDHQVTNQFSNSLPQANQVSINPGYGNVEQQQTSDGITSLVINTPENVAPPLVEDCREVKENCHNDTTISNDSNDAMQRLLKVLTSISSEALMASCEEIGVVVQLNDDKSILEPLNGPPIGTSDTNLKGIIVSDSQARYLRDDIVPKGRKMNRFINSTPTDDFFLKLTSEEKPFSNSITTQGYYTLLEEIKEINKKLVDTEVVIEKEKTYPGATKGVTEYGEGLTVKLLFNSVTVDLNPTSNHVYGEKSIIKPLRLQIPTSYPHCSPVVLDEMPLEISKDLKDLSMKARLKLEISLQNLNQPLSLEKIAKSWDYCARETICEFAELHGGGTFTSKYGGWEICFNAT